MPRRKKDPIVESGKDMFEKIRWGGINAIWVILMIFVVYSFAIILAGQLNGTIIGTVIIGIAILYIYKSNKEFREWLQSFFQIKK